MPLFKKKKSDDSEMQGPMEGPKNLSVALNIQRKNKKKMAEGGVIQGYGYKSKEEKEAENGPGTQTLRGDGSNASQPKKPKTAKEEAAEKIASQFAKGGVVEAIMAKREAEKDEGRVDLEANDEEKVDPSFDDLNEEAAEYDPELEAAEPDDEDDGSMVSKIMKKMRKFRQD